MLLGTLGASLLGNLLTGKGVIATSQTKEVKNFIRNKNIIANICRIKAYDSIMCK